MKDFFALVELDPPSVLDFLQHEVDKSLCSGCLQQFLDFDLAYLHNIDWSPLQSVKDIMLTSRSTEWNPLGKCSFILSYWANSNSYSYYYKLSYSYKKFVYILGFAPVEVFLEVSKGLVNVEIVSDEESHEVRAVEHEFLDLIENACFHDFLNQDIKCFQLVFSELVH